MLMSGVLLTIATVPSLTARVQEGAGNRYGSPLQTSGKTQSSSLGGMTRLSLPAGNEEKSVSPVHNGFSVPVSRTFMRETAGFPVIYGNIIFSEKSENKGFSIIGADGSFTPVNPEPYVGFTAVVLDNVYYSFVQTEINGETKNVMHRFSVKDGFAYLGSKVMPDGSRPEVAATDGQTVYGCFIGSNDAFYMGTLNLTTGSVTRIGDTFQWQSAAIGSDGTLYVIDYQSKLYKVDKSNANASLIGTTGALPKYYTGAAYDRRSGKIYWTVCPEDESGRLYEINTATGVATQLAKFRYNEQITGLYIPYYADAVPAAPQEMTTEFVGSNLTGKVNITVSDKNYNGAAISFPISCTVTAGDAATTEGQTITKTVQVTKAGTLSVPMTVTHDGLWRFTAWLHNTAGESPAATTKVSVGNDQPVAPQNITLEYDGSKFVLAWDSVRTSANNGWLDAEAMTYKVVRYPDDQTVAENLSVTNFTDAVAEPSGRKDYHYGVVAVCHGRVSEEGLSPIVAIGSEVMPWSHTFNTEESAQGFTILDANMDGITWGWSSQRKALYCSYNATLDMDDWVMSPGLRLEGGKVYKVTMKTSCRNVKYPEKFEAFLGKERKPEAMTMEVIPRTVIKTAYSSPLDYTGYIAIREGGTYYLGVHGCSEAGQYEAYLHDMSVSSPSDAKIPGMVEEFRVLPDSIGALGVTVSYNAPSKNMLGENLASISKIETWRDGVLIHTVTSPAPGSKISFTETLPSKSDYEYKVISYNTYGNSPEVIKSIFIGGMPYPADVKSLTAIETETAGSVKVEWPFVTTDQNGNPLDVKYVKYEIVNAKKKNRVVGTVDGNTNTFVWKALNPDDDQETIKVGVRAVTDRGSSAVVSTNNIYVGRDYTLPYQEGFPGGKITKPMSTFLYGGTSVWATGDASLFEIEDANGDNGVAYYRGSAGEAAILHTAKITLAQTQNPTFTFQVYNFGTASEPVMDEIGAMALNTETHQWEELTVKPISQLPGADKKGWLTVIADLSKFKGKRVQVGVLGRMVDGTSIVADNFCLSDMLQYNMSAEMGKAPSMVESGKAFTIPVTVTNKGAKAAENVVVTLKRNGKERRIESLGTVQPGAICKVSFTDTLNMTHEGQNLYQAIVAADRDDNADDNVTAEVQVDIAIPSRNRPTNLVATDGGHKASLTWNAPAKGNNNNEVNEDFETAEACGTAVSGWTMVDGDNHAVGGFSGLELPGITPGTTKMPFFVFDNSSSDFNESFKTTSGTHFLAALYPSGTVPARDWAISPLLDGSEQTITFMAKSYSGSYREHLKVMASTAEGTDTISFTKIADYPSLSNGWTQYSVKLPAGTRRFALVSVATDALMMMIDDVHFVRALSENESKVAGYNIYRDNVLLTTVGPESCKYDDTPFKKAVYTYHVTAVYADGVESGASNSTSITMSVAGIDVDSADHPVEWYTPTGIYIGCKQPTAPGVYIRKQGGRGRKVVVK